MNFVNLLSDTALLLTAVCSFKLFEDYTLKAVQENESLHTNNYRINEYIVAKCPAHTLIPATSNPDHEPILVHCNSNCKTGGGASVFPHHNLHH